MRIDCRGSLSKVKYLLSESSSSPKSLEEILLSYSKRWVPWVSCMPKSKSHDQSFTLAFWNLNIMWARIRFMPFAPAHFSHNEIFQLQKLLYPFPRKATFHPKLSPQKREKKKREKEKQWTGRAWHGRWMGWRKMGFKNEINQRGC